MLKKSKPLQRPRHKFDGNNISLYIMVVALKFGMSYGLQFPLRNPSVHVDTCRQISIYPFEKDFWDFLLQLPLTARRQYRRYFRT